MVIVPNNDDDTRQDEIKAYLQDSKHWFCIWKIKASRNEVRVTAFPKKHETYIALKFGAEE